MSQESQTASGNPVENSGGNNQENDVVAYTTYKKTVGEVKSLKAKLAELEAEKEQQRLEKLSQEGKWKESADDWAKKAKEAEEKAMKIARTFGQKVFAQEAKSVALELGATPEALDDIIKVGDWSEIEIGDDFSIDKEKLKSSIARMQQSKPFYFKKTVNAPKDVIPGMQQQSSGSKKLDEMSIDELVSYAKSNHK